MATPPIRDDDARRAALAKATDARRARAELKNELKQRLITLAEVLDRADGDERVAKTKVLTVLEALPGVGKVKARRTMTAIGIAENRRIGGLGRVQRAKLLEAFD
jgi:hypothetical protein